MSNKKIERREKIAYSAAAAAEAAATPAQPANQLKTKKKKKKLAGTFLVLCTTLTNSVNGVRDTN